MPDCTPVFSDVLLTNSITYNLFWSIIVYLRYHVAYVVLCSGNMSICIIVYFLLLDVSCIKLVVAYRKAEKAFSIACSCEHLVDEMKLNWNRAIFLEPNLRHIRMTWEWQLHCCRNRVFWTVPFKCNCTANTAHGLVVMEGDSCSEVCGFKPHIVDWHFFTLICCKNCNACVWKDENEKKNWPGMVI